MYSGNFYGLRGRNVWKRTQTCVKNTVNLRYSGLSVAEPKGEKSRHPHLQLATNKLIITD